MADGSAADGGRTILNRGLVITILNCGLVIGLQRSALPRQRDLVKTAIVLLAVGVLGIAAILYGDADDAPGSMLLGGLLIIGALAFGVRTARTCR